jgi:hypothetical protein
MWDNRCNNIKNERRTRMVVILCMLPWINWWNTTIIFVHLRIQHTHTQYNRKGLELIKLSCAAVPDTLYRFFCWNGRKENLFYRTYRSHHAHHHVHDMDTFAAIENLDAKSLTKRMSSYNIDCWPIIIIINLEPLNTTVESWVGNEKNDIYRNAGRTFIHYGMMLYWFGRLGTQNTSSEWSIKFRIGNPFVLAIDPLHSLISGRSGRICNEVLAMVSSFLVNTNIIHGG